MEPLGSNPFAILTFIAAPAILTNASSVMALGTSNRFARAIDRARGLAADLEAPGRSLPEVALRSRQLTYASRRVLILVRPSICRWAPSPPPVLRRCSARCLSLSDTKVDGTPR